MNTYIKKLSYLFLSLTLILGACDANESLTVTSPEAEFVLKTPGISNIFLNFALPDNPAFTITWNDDINTGATYSVEMSLDAEFSAPVVLGSTENKNFSMTVAELNDVLSDANIKSYEETGVYLRLNTGSEVSNTILFQVSKFVVTPPTFTSPDNGFSVVITDTNPDDIALTLTWEDPEITANSTVDVTYNVEMDLAGNNFAAATLIGSSDTNTFEISHDNLNDLVIAAGGKADEATDFDFRLIAVAKTAGGDLNRTSELITLSLTAFKAAIPDNLYMVGAHNGWNNADATQQFYNDGNGVFSRVQTFSANDEFKMIPVSGDWGGDYGEDPNNPGKIVQEGENNIKVETAGTYLVIVDFNTLSFKLSNIDTLFMVGAHNGWNNADASQQFSTSGNGVFTRMQTFSEGDEFKMIPVSGDWSGDYGEDPNNPGKIIQEGENNIKVAAAGTFMVTVDFNDLSFRLVEVPVNLYLVGSPNGWDNASAPAFTKLEDGVFEITQTLTASDEFKFLPVQGSWDNDWGESGTYAGMLVRDNESNVKSPGDGTYKVTVDYTKGTVTVQ